MKFRTYGERISVKIIELYEKIAVLQDRYDILAIKYDGLLDEKEKLEKKLEECKNQAKDGDGEV